jgi:hypothetical protein
MPEGHPYMTAGDVWRRVHGAFPMEQRTSLPMRIGSALEAGILQLVAAENGWQVKANRHTFYSRTAPLCATPDARILGTDELVEVKYSGRAEMWVNLPPHVYWQVQAQMACVERIETVHVVVLVGTRLIAHSVDRNHLAIRRLSAAARELVNATECPAGDLPAVASTIDTASHSWQLPLSLRGNAR